MLFAAIVMVQALVAQQPYPPAQSNLYNTCVMYAQQQTGYQGASTQSAKAQNAPLRGAAGGAAAGALIGGMGGGNSGQGAAIGAGFGLIAGAARRNKVQQQQQAQETNFYNVLNACLAQGH